MPEPKQELVPSDDIITFVNEGAWRYDSQEQLRLLGDSETDDWKKYIIRFARDLEEALY